MDADKAQAIVDAAAAKPKTVSADRVSVERDTLKDLQDWADKKASNDAIKRKNRGIAFTRLVPPGSC